MPPILLEGLLSEGVSRPARYIGEELNSLKKDLRKVEIKVALCFPDVYEVGMSHLGIRILYHILNSQKNIACERVFSPWPDFEKVLRNSGTPIFSLESRLPLGNFDIIGFSLEYELNYTNVLNILDLAGIPLKREERNSGHPLIMAGGPSCSNPEPMAAFIDFFCIGEAEDLILKVMEVFAKFKSYERKKLLSELAKIQGVYVPSLYEVNYNKDGTIKDFSPLEDNAPPKIKKQIAPSLAKEYFPVSWITPLIYLVHDRVSLEVSRGCPNKCRFCQGRSVYYPYRQRSAEDILDLAKKSLAASGYEEISLFGLSVADHPQIAEIVDSLIEKCKEQAIAVSLSSLKVKPEIDEIFSLISKVRKTGLTFAPEAGSQRLRALIDKDLNIADLYKIIETAYRSGFRHVKLYFMIGLPTEEDQDLDAIIDLAREVACLKMKFSRSPAQVNLSIANFIPKPHTSFQWLAMATREELKAKQLYLKAKANNIRNLKLSFHHLESSFLEALISNGDRQLSEVILKAYLKGARFDAWDEFFKFNLWQESLEECGIDPTFYINRNKDLQENLAWDHIDIGWDKKILQEDLLGTKLSA